MAGGAPCCSQVPGAGEGQHILLRESRIIRSHGDPPSSRRDQPKTLTGRKKEMPEEKRKTGAHDLTPKN